MEGDAEPGPGPSGVGWLCAPWHLPTSVHPSVHLSKPIALGVPIGPKHHWVWCWGLWRPALVAWSDPQRDRCECGGSEGGAGRTGLLWRCR